MGIKLLDGKGYQVQRKGLRKTSVHMVQKTFVGVILIFVISPFPGSCDPLELVFEFPLSFQMISF